MKCNARRASKDGVCYKCASEGLSQEEERILSKEYNGLITKHDVTELWLSPKTMLLASLVGCTCCGVRNDSNIWMGELEGWGDGLCPDCLKKFPLGYTWSLPKTVRSNTPLESYKECQICLSHEYDYSLWGHCEVCMQEWQDQFLDPLYLYNFVEEYGALAALLVRSSSDWINYLKDTLQHKYCWNPKNKNFPEDAELTPFNPRMSNGRIIRNFNIKSMVDEANSEPEVVSNDD